jgi:hypothetical protein
MMLATSSTCGLPAARAAIVQTHLRMKTIGDSARRVAPGSADEVVCADFTGDGRTDIAVTIASGGTAGDIGFVVFRRTSTGWAVALTQGGYKLGLFRRGNDLVWSQPVYRKNDPNCCPTGGFDHAQLHWSGSRFVVARSWHTRAFAP